MITETLNDDATVLLRWGIVAHGFVKVGFVAGGNLSQGVMSSNGLVTGEFSRGVMSTGEQIQQRAAHCDVY